jgi:hypothetical protein
MRVVPFLCSLALTFAASALSYQSNAKSEEWHIAFGRIGPIRIGMSADAIQKAKGSQLEREGTLLREISKIGCDFVYLSNVYLQFNDGRLDEIVTTSGKFRTAEGIGVGSRFEEVARIYGSKGPKPHLYKLIIGSNHYDEAVPQVKVEAPPAIRGKFGKASVSIQFEFEAGKLTDSSRVQEISIGRHPVEGCS